MSLYLLSPSLRLKEPQKKLTSCIPPERLQEISWQDFWRSHAPRGASKNPVKDFGWWDLDGVCLSGVWCLVSVCAVVNGSLDLAARAIVLQAFLFD